MSYCQGHSTVLLSACLSGVQPAVSDGGTRGTMQGVAGGRGEGRVGYEEV